MFSIRHCRQANPMQAIHGGSMIELLISIVVLSIGLGFTAVDYSESTEKANQYLIRTQAVSLAANIASGLRINAEAARGGDYDDFNTDDFTDPTATPSCGNNCAIGGPGSSLADRHKYRWSLPFMNQGYFISSFPQGRATITRTVSSGIHFFTIRVVWKDDQFNQTGQTTIDRSYEMEILI